MPGIRKVIWEKLGFTKANTGCCGNLWRSRRPSTEIDPVTHGNPAGDEICEIPAQEAVTEMNSATAERRMRAEDPSSDAAMDKPALMTWLEEDDDETERQAVGLGESCCVCMERKKGAAFIPCGHAFCRVCARELWIERRSCPLCNQTILEVLDIF